MIIEACAVLAGRAIHVQVSSNADRIHAVIRDAGARVTSDLAQASLHVVDDPTKLDQLGSWAAALMGATACGPDFILRRRGTHSPLVQARMHHHGMMGLLSMLSLPGPWLSFRRQISAKRNMYISENFSRMHPVLTTLVHRCMAAPVSRWRKGTMAILSQPGAVLLVTREERQEDKRLQKRNVQDESTFLPRFLVVENSHLNLAGM